MYKKKLYFLDNQLSKKYCNVKLYRKLFTVVSKEKLRVCHLFNKHMTGGVILPSLTWRLHELLQL